MIILSDVEVIQNSNNKVEVRPYFDGARRKYRFDVGYSDKDGQYMMLFFSHPIFNEDEEAIHSGNDLVNKIKNFKVDLSEFDVFLRNGK